MLEGLYGTKAEAEAHADFAITNMEQRHLEATMGLNWHLVNDILILNFGEETQNSVWIKPAPIADAKRALLIQLYTTFLRSPDVLLQEYANLDTEAIAEQLQLPLSALSSENPIDEPFETEEQD